MERVSQPVAGFRIASYTVKSEKGFLGLARVCPAKADDVWDCPPLNRIAVGPLASEMEALDAAENKARLTVLRRVVQEITCHSMV